MTKNNKQQPAFTVGGSFHALAVDHLASDQSEEEEEEEKDREREREKEEEIEKEYQKRNTLVSPTSKKAKQRAKDRAKRLNQITIPTSQLNISQAKQIPPKPQPDSPKKEKIIQNTHPIKPTTPRKHQFNVDQTISSPKETENDLNHLNPNEITSPTPSTLNSLPTSPSTTDLEDDDSYELNHQQLPPSNGSEELNLKICHVDIPQRSTTKEDPDRSYPESPTTARPFALQSVSTPRPTHNPTKSSPKLNASTDDSTQFGADHTPGKKWQTVLTRVIWSLVMVTGFITLMALGHLYLIILIFIIQLLVFREVTNLFQVGYKASAKEQAKNQLLQQSQQHYSSPLNSTTSPSSGQNLLVVKEKKRIKDVGDKNRTNKIMSWYFFGVANYFLYGESIIYYFKHISYIDDWYLMQFGRHHRFISLLLYLIGFLGFVTNLDRGHLRRQFGLFSWIHMSLLLIIVFGQFMVNNILEGLIWFWVPASLVIMNDVAAYVFGMLFGKHQLIKLSPKKTVEGFVGGFFMTVLFGVLWGSIFMGWNYMICPVKELGMTAFSEVKCDPNPVFKWRSLQVAELLISQMHPVFSPMIQGILSNRFVPKHIWWTPFQLHCLVLATFAGLVAPFGGFFASGFKRAFNVKDFGHTIPGHGGLTDRFDCQFIMGLFTYFYYSSLVKEDDNLNTLNKLTFSVASIFNIISNSLNDQEQLELFVNLKRLLDSKGLL